MNILKYIGYPLLLLVFFGNASFCQSSMQTLPSGKYIITISVTTKPLKILVYEGALFNNLGHDILYQTIASNVGVPYNIFPSIRDEEFSPARIEISGDPSDNVAVSFQLPSRIYDSTGDGNFIYMAYNNLSASLVDHTTGSQQFFNPQKGTRLTLPADGSNAILLFGGNPIVPTNAPPGDYMGEAIVSVSYIGGS